MIYLVAALFAASVMLVVVAVGSAMTARPRAIDRRLTELEEFGTSREVLARRRRQAQRERFSALLEQLGERVKSDGPDVGPIRQFLTRAGFRRPGAVAVYWGIRLTLTLGLTLLGLVVIPLTGAALPITLLAVFWLAAMGWILPVFYVGQKMRARQKDLLHALPDALDLLVVCVEAGLGLNQALVRVSEEITHVSKFMSAELALVNLEIRAGVPRDDALRNLAERTGVQDIQSLTAMLIQTDRFGTSIATALRVHSDTLRTKRRQRAEEAAAKTTIKLVFPLVLFIFPAMFVVILGSAMIQILKALGNF